MPELPEVEVCRALLASWSEGQRLMGVELPDPAVVRGRLSTRPSDGLEDAEARIAALVGAVCTGASRHGKRALWRFGDRALLLHLGMTGRWVRREDGATPRWGRIGLTFEAGATLWFIDTRRFGCVVPGPLGSLEEALVEGHGPDALLAPLGGEELARRCATARPIKVVLMEQQRLAGLGNIQAIEALWRAGLAPTRAASSLEAEDWARLAEAIQDQLRETLRVTSSEEVTYLVDGAANPFAIYARSEQPCPRCEQPILRSVLGGRATFSCPRCQPTA